MEMMPSTYCRGLSFRSVDLAIPYIPANPHEMLPSPLLFRCHTCHLYLSYPRD